MAEAPSGGEWDCNQSAAACEILEIFLILISF